AAVLCAAEIRAQSSVWNTGADNWSNAASWLPATAPVSGTSTVLTFGGSSSYTATNDLSGTFQFNRLLFNNSAGTVTLAGNALNVVNPLNGNTVLPTLALTGAGNATISAPMTWSGETAVTNSGSGTLLFNGNQTYNNGTKQTFINSGTGTITLADAVTYANTGGVSGGGIVLNLINNNSATGSFNVGNLGALGSGSNLFYLNIGGTGTVRFSGSINADLFSAAQLLTVQSGATFDFNGNGETMGAIAGAGTIAMTSGASITTNLAGYYVFSGKLTGSGALAVSAGTQTLVLSGSTSNYTGATSVLGGTLIVSANAPSGSAGALGNATTAVLVGNTSGAVSARLLMDTAGVTIGRNIMLQSGNTGTATVGGLNTTGTVTYTGNITLGTASAAAKGLTLYSASGGTVQINGNLLRAVSATGSTDTLTVTGGGTVALLSSGNTFTGGTTVSGGTLLLDHSVSNNAKLSSTAALTLNGGSLSLSGSSTAASTQMVNGLTLGNSATPLGGSGQINVTSGTDQNATLDLGAITRNTGATVDFSANNTSTGVASITTTTANTASGILGGYATYKLDDWAVNDGAGNITALAAGSYTTSFGSGLATSLSGSTALASGGATTNTLRFTSGGALTFNATTPGTLTLESGGILIASTAGATSIGSSTTRGTLTSSTGEVIVNQQSSSGPLTIHSVISGSGLTVSGSGTVTLTATNTFTGSLVINNGATVAVSANGNLGAATTAIILNGGTLKQTTGNLSFSTPTAAAHSIYIGPAGGTLSFATVQGLSGAALSGSGNLTVTGGGGFTTGSSVSTFTGNIYINNAAIYSNSSQLTSAASVTVASGATWGVEDDSTATFNIASGGRIMLNGRGLGGNGALRVSDQTVGTALLDPRTTIGNEIVLQSDSLIEVDNGNRSGSTSVAGSLSVLTLSGSVSGTGALIKGGLGNLILSGANNTYSGATNVEAGMLILNLGNDRLPTGTSVTLGSGSNSGILQLNGFSQSIAGLDTSGTGTDNSVLGGSSTSTSLLNVNVSSGTQTYSGTLGGVGTNNTGANNNLGFIKNGAGTFVLSGANNHTGGTTVAQGALALGNAAALGNNGATLATSAAGTVVNAGATLDLNGQSNVQGVITLNGTGVSNGGALVNNSDTAASIGSGIASLTLPSATTTGWSVGATVSLDAPTTGTNATATALLGLSASSLNLTAGGSGYVLAPVVTVSGGGGTGAVVTANMGVTTASYTVTSGTTTYSSAPTVTLSNGATATANLDANGKVTSITLLTAGSGFTGTPTIKFTGGTVLSQGTDPTGSGNSTHFTIVGLNVINGGTGYTSLPTVSISGGTGAAATVVDGNFVLNGVDLTDSGSGYSSAPTVTVTGGTATATANVTSVALASDSSIGGSGNLTVNAVISGEYGLTKVGTGTTTLTGANTYTGATVVNGGALQVGANGAGQTGTGAVSVQSGSMLLGTGYVQGSSFTAASGSTVQAGDSTAQSSYGTLHFTPTAGSGSIDFQAGSTIVLGINPGGVSDMLQITGTGSTTVNFNGNLTITAEAFTPTATATFHLLDWSGLGAAPTFDSRYNYTGLVYGSGDTPVGLILPDLTGTGFAWDFSAFTSAGDLSIVVANAPEPSRALLLGLSLALLVARRRR
ncbi:MAG: autotransporter-associated beta strand repeat-containing protein, partial [Prosthecobacter sp.]|uniref:beta strand repeat-containing protein n=1 Tax=Prosthecobacter sp. TaxID=1965333 RepID=UPI003BAEE6ED